MTNTYPPIPTSFQTHTSGISAYHPLVAPPISSTHFSGSPKRMTPLSDFPDTRFFGITNLLCQFRQFRNKHFVMPIPHNPNINFPNTNPALVSLIQCRIDVVGTVVASRVRVRGRGRLRLNSPKEGYSTRFFAQFAQLAYRLL